MGIFISVPKTLESIFIAAAFAVMMCFAVYKQTGVLQSSGYSSKKYFKWLVKKGNLSYARFILLALMCALSSAVISLCFSFTGWGAPLIGLIGYLIFFAVYTVADKKVALRSEVTFTPRLYRLYAVSWLIFAIVSYILVTGLNFADYVWGNQLFGTLKYTALAVLPLLIIPLLLFANCAVKIYEVPHNNGFIKKARKKLASSDIKVIGITGSYGKTSAKFILEKILSVRYRVLTTPRSHNTPIGLALALNNHDLSEYDIFIAEMGARHRGDIAELCGLCPPDISMITGICGQHLETFGTFENIVYTKGEILTATKSSAVLADDCYDLFAEYPCAKVRADCVSDIECTCKGTDFTLTLGGESRRVHTVLLGKHSAYNIGLCASAAYTAGMSLDEICEGVKNITYIEHRLQLIEANGVNILDDGYNSNVKGARAALEVLKTFGGKKIVVTPGLVELGVLEEQENYSLGKNLVGYDLVILVGDTLLTPVKQGYLEGGGDADKLFIAPTLAKAQEELQKHIQKGDTVLFLNDLPDIY
ncbi:MAG: UDP-N-acetylmuramoyl-tripeptide--D-alanyl-D-alanine ligase [Clostridia bacterium]|nr:UDP-N-acetylmuramoyl-tripeptide--D-alanyl-D-alanine ligase [Clostridia bacterium]